MDSKNRLLKVLESFCSVKTLVKNVETFIKEQKKKRKNMYANNLKIDLKLKKRLVEHMENSSKMWKNKTIS